MNGNYYAIDIWGLIAALVMVAIAAGISETMRMGVGRTLLWSACRALLQLCAMGFIMEYVIRSNNPWLVLLLVAFMLIAAVQINSFACERCAEGLGWNGVPESGRDHAHHDLVGHRAHHPSATVVCAAIGGAVDRHAAGQHRFGVGGGVEPVL